MEVTLLSSCEENTLEIARALGEILGPGDVVALTGDLGAGKTVFCKGVGEALGISPTRIVSPSFTIVTEHPGRLALCHVDGTRDGLRFVTWMSTASPRKTRPWTSVSTRSFPGTGSALSSGRKKSGFCCQTIVYGLHFTF